MSGQKRKGERKEVEEGKEEVEKERCKWGKERRDRIVLGM